MSASWRDRLANWISPRNETTLPMLFRSSQSWSDVVDAGHFLNAPSEMTALTSSAIYASVNLIAGAIAALPLPIYARKTDGELSELSSDALWWVLNEEMMPRWSAANGWEFLTQSLLLHGNAYAVIGRTPDARPASLEPVHPDRVQVVPSSDGRRLIYAIEADPAVPSNRTGRKVFDQDDILHVAGFGFDGVKGLSMLRYALRMAGGVSLSMQDFAAQFFDNSARPDFVLEADGKLGEETVERLYAKLDDRNATARGHAHRPLILGSGLKFKPITMPIDDMMLLDQRRFQVEEIARIYGVPAFMIGHTDKTTSWGSGVEQMGTGFVRYALRQHLNKFETELNRKLFRTATRLVKFDTTELERADTKSLMESLRIGLGRAGEERIISVNEARAVLRRNKVSGGDAMGPAPGQSQPGQDGASTNE